MLAAPAAMPDRRHTAGRRPGRRSLILLFGLSAERVRHLTADQLTHDNGQDFLTAGRRPILLPPRLAKLLQRLGTDPNAG
jgi:hypothetical protein